MLQIMKYHFRILLRNREQMFWILLFPILLGIMFKVAFSNISSSEIQKPVSIAVVEENNSDALKSIKTFLEKTELKDGVALFVPTYCTEEKAVSLLRTRRWMAFCIQMILHLIQSHFPLRFLLPALIPSA